MIVRAAAGDILDTSADIVVVPVDCGGDLAAGLARRAQRAWPNLLDEYRALLGVGLLRPGQPRFAHAGVDRLPAVLLFPIAERRRDGASLDLIDSCLAALPRVLEECVLARTIAMPKLRQGHTGRPGLDWQRHVAPLLARHLDGVVAVVEVYETDDELDHEPDPLDHVLSAPNWPATAPDPDLAAFAGLLRRNGLPAATLRRYRAAVDPGVLRLWVRNDTWPATWSALRALLPQTGRWPVMLGPPWHVYVAEDDGYSHAFDATVPIFVEAILREASTIDGATWLRRQAEHTSWPLDYTPTAGDPTGISIWPESAPPRRTFAEGNEPGAYRVGLVAMGLLPTSAGWQAPAYLDWRTGNYDLGPADHVRLMAHWWERYGAEPAAMWNETIEFHVTRPPRDRASELAVAEEHFIYCPDRLQEVDSIEALAAELLDAPVWHFWWD